MRYGLLNILFFFINYLSLMLNLSMIGKFKKVPLILSFIKLLINYKKNFIILFTFKKKIIKLNNL